MRSVSYSSTIATLHVIPFLLAPALDASEVVDDGNGQGQLPDAVTSLGKWRIAWEDDFSGDNASLDERWVAQNGSNGHILCSRWRENVVMRNGFVSLINKKEERGGQSWTSGSIWTRKVFQYGYFEAAYKYASAPATNNSFWIMSNESVPLRGKRFEIDINEGRYPNEVATNIHNWTDIINKGGSSEHPNYPRVYRMGSNPEFSLVMERPIFTRRLRLRSLDLRPSPIHLREFNAYAPASRIKSKKRDGEKLMAGDNLVAKSKISSSGSFDTIACPPSNVVDAKNDTRWVSQRDGDKWIEFDLQSRRSIGSVVFSSGYESKRDESDGYLGILDQYELQYDDNGDWKTLASTTIGKDLMDMSVNYHRYGLLWTEDELVFFMDGIELRRERNMFCHSPAPIYLSSAIIAWAGPITDRLDGSAMVIDYVRHYLPSVD